MSSNAQQSTSRSIEIDESTVRKRAVHDGEMEVDYDRIVPRAINEVTSADGVEVDD